jgi:hypothetical protein
MKRNLVISLLSISTLAAYAVTPEVAEYRARMDHAQDLQDSIRDGLRSKDSKTVSALGHELTTLLQEDQHYWEKQQLSDALDLSKESVRLAQQMTTDASEDKIPEALDNFKQLQKTCQSCHDAHPEKRVK